MSRHPVWATLPVHALAAALASAPARLGAQELEPSVDLTEIPLEELMKISVVTVTKEEEPLLETPAAVYVITHDALEQSGLRHLAEALRLSPGVSVSRISSNQWAVGVRGFQSRIARAQLVLRDGRSVYTPLFAGTFWDVQDYLLEDVERIEVVRGPGGTIWGANAVNGVVNIVTRNARDTQGPMLLALAGTEERFTGEARYGGTAGDDLSYRVWGKYLDRDSAFFPQGASFDDWWIGSGGFRTDWEPNARDAVTLQADTYDGREGQRRALTLLEPPFTTTVVDDARVSGGNVVGQWRRRLADGASLRLQGYYDYTFRREANFAETRHTGDLDYVHWLPPLGPNTFSFGLGTRVTSSEADEIPALRFQPSERTDLLFTAFLQDEIAIVPERVRLTLGSRFEHNEFSGVEYQPSARLLWTPHPDHALWTAVTRAVRTPTPVEHDFEFTTFVQPDPVPTFARSVRDRKFETERLWAYEAGYRVRPVRHLFVDLALFYNEYPNLLSTQPGEPIFESTPTGPRVIVPLFVRNQLFARTYGAELAAEVEVTARWRLTSTYSLLKIEAEPRSGGEGPQIASVPIGVDVIEGSDPRHQVSLRSTLRLPRDVTVTALGWWIDGLPARDIGDYVRADLRIAWKPIRSLQVAAVGQHLVETRHAEFRTSPEEPSSTETERGVYGLVRWTP